MSSYYDDASLMLLASGGAQKDGKVYSVKPTDGSGDFTFTRGSNLSATRVDASQLIEKGRENLMLYSQDWTNAAWNKTNISVSGDAISNPINSANTADSILETTGNGQHNFFQLIGSYSSGVSIAISFYAKANGRTKLRMNNGSSTITAVFDLVQVTAQMSAGIGIPIITSVGNDWYRCSLFFPSTGGTQYLAMNFRNDLNQDVYVGDVTKGMYFFGAQAELGLVATPYIETGATTGKAGILENTPRFDYSGGATCPSLLLEPSRTNAITYSEYFSSWTLYAGILTPNATISPEGVQNAYLFTEDTTTGYHRFSSGAPSATSSNKLYSVYAKWAGGTGRKWLTVDNGPTAWFDLENGVVGAAQGSVVISMEDVGNGWYRCIYYNPASTTSGIFIGIALNNGGAGNHLGNGQPAFSIYGAQCEDNTSYPTSYIPTYGVSQTRAQDLCNSAGDAATFNDSEGVLYAETSVLSNDLNIEAISISDGTGNNRVVIFKWNTSNAIRARITSGGYSVNLDFQVSDITSINKIAVKYKTNDFALWINGVEVRTNTNGSNPSGLNQLSFNSDGGTGAPFFGKTKEVIYFPTALSDLDLAILTGATTYNTFAEMALALNYTVYE